MGSEDNPTEVGSTSGSAPGTSIKVYIPHERPICVFRGDEDDVDAFIRETEQVIRSRGLKNPDDIELVTSYLEGEARREVTMRPNYDGIQALYTVLRDAYGDARTVPQLLRAFYDRKQRNGETLRHFSHSLETLASKIAARHEGALPQSDATKRDQFAEGLFDVALRQNIKRMIRDSADVTFLQIRKEACLWAEETEGSAACQNMSTTMTQDTKLMDIVSSLTEQMAQLTSAMAKLTAEQQTRAPVHTGTSTSYNNTGITPSTQRPRRPITCYGCGRQGHMVKFCQQRQQFYSRPSGNSSPQLPGASN